MRSARLRLDACTRIKTSFSALAGAHRGLQRLYHRQQQLSRRYLATADYLFESRMNPELGVNLVLF